jgi:DNA-3-methyladenine glycosylase
MSKLRRDFFIREDVVRISRELIGKYIFTNFDGLTGGIITETEAYAGITDKASHAFNGRRTFRNEVMYAEGGIAYVYLCYGIHFMLNFVTNQQNVPHAILLRGIQPTCGLELMKMRRGKSVIVKNFTIGPGTVTQALGINLDQNGLSLNSSQLWLEDRNFIIPELQIKCGKRIGVDYAGEDAALPYRFWIDPL